MTDLFVLQVRDSTPYMDGSRPWKDTSLPMSGWDMVQAVALLTRRIKSNGMQMEDYRIVLAEGCSFDCDVCND